MLQDLQTLADYLRQTLVEVGVAGALRLEHRSDVADVGPHYGVRLAPHEAGKISTRPESPSHHLSRQLCHRQRLQALHLSTKCGVRGLRPVASDHALVFAAEHFTSP